MKTKYIYILMLGLLSVFSTGCEDRLDIAKHGNMGSQEDFIRLMTMPYKLWLLCIVVGEAITITGFHKESVGR